MSLIPAGLIPNRMVLHLIVSYASLPLKSLLAHFHSHSVAVDSNNGPFRYFLCDRSHTIVHTNEDHFDIDTKHTIVAHTEAPPQPNCQPQPVHSL